MAYSTVILDKAEGIATITLNRPEKLNAFNDTMFDELPEAFGEVEQDNDIRVLVITGANHNFCAGADIKGIFLKGIEERKAGVQSNALAGWMQNLCSHFKNMTKPVIASIDGYSIGIGLTVPLQCDLRIASEAAVFSIPFVRLGIMPELGSTYFLTRLIGMAKACELAFTGKYIGAKEAKEIGLVNEVVPATELEEATYKLAKTIAEGSPLAMRMTKIAFYQGLDAYIEQQLQHEISVYDILLQSEDHEEGIRSFLEKRQPIFKGK